jgi:predicted transcriptional regulator of viral defense system
LVHFPAGQREDLVVAWLWSDRQGVVSHETALELWELSDVLPSVVSLTLPQAWRTRRLRIPKGIQIAYADLAPDDWQWFGAVPITAPRRSLNDCAAAALAPDLLRQAAASALRRGLVERSELGAVEEVLAPYGGLP